MNWLSLIFLALRYLPEIIKVVAAIVALINGLKDKREAKIEMRKLRHNVHVAKESKDFSGLEAQLADLKKKCESC